MSSATGRGRGSAPEPTTRVSRDASDDYMQHLVRIEQVLNDEFSYFTYIATYMYMNVVHIMC